MWIFSKWRWASLAPAEDASCPFNSFHPSLLVKTGCFTFSSGSCCHYVFHYRCDPEMLKFLILLILYAEAPWSPHPLLPTCRHSHAAVSLLGRLSTVMTEPWLPPLHPTFLLLAACPGADLSGHIMRLPCPPASAEVPGGQIRAGVGETAGESLYSPGYLASSRRAQLQGGGPLSRQPSASLCWWNACSSQLCRGKWKPGFR